MSIQGTLFVVATPIGNLQDITLRALETLKNVGTIVCEDTRVTSVLLHKYEIKKPMIAINEFNEEQTVYQIIKLLGNQDVALVSDAGTPLISDPGYRLSIAAKKHGVRIIPIPGVTAATAALSAAALPTDRFLFLGFLPKSATRSKKILEEYKAHETTIILYESPHRILATIRAIKEVYGNIEITIARELTKLHEEIIAQKADTLIEKFTNTQPKGEIVVLFSTKPL